MDLFLLRSKLTGHNDGCRDDIQPGNNSRDINKKFIIGFLALFCISMAYNAFGQRNMEYLTRGLVAVKTSENVFIGWRIFATDRDSVEFNLYRNDTLVNQSPIAGISNYVDSSGSVKSIYYLETIYNSGKTEISTPVTVWQEEYKTIPLQAPDGYYPNDASVADLDGDGELEIIVKMQTSNPDNTHEVITDPVLLNAYKLNGILLWSINLGVNIRAGAHYTQFMVYDLDGDGMAEVACKTAPGTKDGTGGFLSKGPAATDDDSQSYVDGNGRILSGPEYLTVFNGLTGEETTTVYYNPRRHRDTENPTGSQLNAEWGDNYGNRVDRFLACVAYFDTVPSLVMCRGYYTRTVLAAYDFSGGELTQRWVFDSDEGFPGYAAQGNHNLGVADVDEDGKDEIVYGAMCVDDDGTGLWTTGLGHGDAMHVSDIDPDRPGLEKWGINEQQSKSGSQLLDAKTGEIIWETAPGDVARGVSADLSAEFFGMECWGGTEMLRSAKNEFVGQWPSSANFLVWWDGDLLRELLNDVTVSKYNTSGDITLLSANGCLSNNSSKATPNFSGDILGDWREEVILRTSDNQALRIYTTTAPTQYGIYTLLQDPQYRLALVWQNVGYNQPPHPGYYLGHGMDTGSLPVPDIKVRQADIPSIRVNSPVNGFELGLGLDLDVIVHAVGVSGTDQTIIISNGATPLDTILSPPYYTSISGLPSGDYSLVASAFDIKGGLMISDTLHITIDEGYPHVTLTSPVKATTFVPEDSITVVAEAYDTDGSIDSVAFYMNDTRVAALSAPPYSKKIENPGVGIYELKAIAYDNNAKFTASEAINIAVGMPVTIQEAELGFCGFANGTGTIDANNPGFTGSGFANTANASGVQTIWAVNIPVSATYKFEWRYASSNNRPGNLFLNNTMISELSFASTGGWDTWTTASADAYAQAGINKVSIEALTGDGLGNIDYMKIYALETTELVTGLHCDSLIPPDDATLSGLRVDGEVLAPAFNANRFAYTVALDEGTSEMNIVATPTDPNASLSGDGTVSLTPSPGSVNVVVTSRNSSNTETYTINYSFTTSMNELTVPGLKVYPMPAQDFINIQFSDRVESINDISIYSIDGRKILSTGTVKNNQARIELPGMQNGIYLIHINTNYKSYSSKFDVYNK